MKRMKHHLIVIAGILLIFPGCEKYLDQQPQGTYPVSAFFQTEEHAKLAITSCYEKIAFSNSNNRLWVFADVASDDAVKGGFPGDQADIGLIDNFQISADNGNGETTWEIFYEGVARCNLVLKHVPGIEMDRALQERIIGEAYFLRGYCYFQLCNIFGNIPLILEPKNPDEMQVPNSTRQEVYEQVEIDFIEAVKYLESALGLDPGVYPGSEKGRATPGAAKALLAKTYLFEEKWSEALTATLEVESYGYLLLPVYQHNFNVLYENNNESVFEIQHLSGKSPVMGSRLNQWLAPRVDNGYGFDEPAQSFVDEFEVTTPENIYDPRLDYTLGRDGKLWFDDVPYNPSWSSTGFNQKKYLQPLSEISKSWKGDANLNFSIIRFADILLIQAEALCELNRCDEALVPLNRVRTRARESYLYDENLEGYGTIPAGLLPDVTTTDQGALRNAIRHERRVELGFECQRYFDIIRYGEAYANNAFSNKPTFNYDTHNAFPIPQSEMETNLKMVQNEGY
ncbi:MAG: RagB/SusD family nutrient uptake outer membrane protein [Bacteroidales bacterium]|nr:RagB/SusD family nutrient uptake outer membrane protein [Bacteroidales bacterium]